MGAVGSPRTPGVNGQRIPKGILLSLFAFIVEPLELLFVFRHESFKFSSKGFSAFHAQFSCLKSSFSQSACYISQS